MRKSYIILLIAALLGMSSCEDYFLQKPMGNDVTAKEVFSSKQKAMSAIAQAYSEALRINITFLENDGSHLYGMTSGTLAHISGELNGFRYNWSDPVIISSSGMSASGPWIDNFTFNYTAIRRCYTVIENIGAVPDMSNEEKEAVRGEMYALIAYRYCRMLIQYGGVPIVKGIVPFDTSTINRSSVKEVLEYIVDLCDNEALPRLPDKQPNDMKGRLTKGAALCIKAQAYLYCARPLFNTATPYLSLGGENDKLICMGEPYNKRLWEQARDAAQAVIDWALTDNRHRIIDTGNPFDDYGRAVGAPDSEEVIVSWQAFNARHYDPRQQGGGANNMSYTQLKQYCKQDGTDQTWPEGLGETEWASISEYSAKLEEMEARYWASAVPGGYDARNNPGSQPWKADAMVNYSTWEGRANIEQCGRRCKFWYHAGTRTWFNFPIYRLAYFYLALAEAKNELGDGEGTRKALNVTRERAGLPDIELTDPAALRKAIQREWAVEFFEENHRLFDVKHWKLEDLNNGIIGGDKKGFLFDYKSSTGGSYSLSNYKGFKVAVSYKGFWSANQYLNPFPTKEVNKGYLVQNPGY